MFLEDHADAEENYSPWAGAFTTFIGAAALLGFLGSVFQGVQIPTEPWDSIDTKAAPKAKAPPTPAPAQQTPSKKRK